MTPSRRRGRRSSRWGCGDAAGPWAATWPLARLAQRARPAHRWPDLRALRALRAQPLAVLLLLSACLLGVADAAHWTHSAELDRNFAVFWTPGEDDITFEVQVRTLGYVGLGFSSDGKMKGADMIIGWVRDGQVFFQVSFGCMFGSGSDRRIVGQKPV